MMTMKSIIVTALSLIAMAFSGQMVTATVSSVDVLPTPENSNSIHKIIQSQKRFVLYNSRRLEGGCLAICNERSDGESDAPRVTKAPTRSPTSSPTTSPTTSPTITKVVDGGKELCECEANAEWEKQSFKCGNDVYVCPGITSICSTQGSANSIYFKITKDQCNDMKAVEIGEKCIALPEYNLDRPKGLSNRVCYGGSEFGVKEDGNCDVCTNNIEPEWQTSKSQSDAPRVTNAPTTSPTSSPTTSPTITKVVDGGKELCECEANAEWEKQSFKCGNDVYVCPGITSICSTQGSANSIYFKITKDQCNDMKAVEIGEKCIALPEYNLDRPKGLSNRVCYGGSEFGVKEDGDCDVCTNNIEPEWQTSKRRWFF